MVYISADGSVDKKPPPRCNIFVGLKKEHIVGVAIIAALINNAFDFGPLANGKVPAAKKNPSDHWSAIANDVSFVRTMTDGLAHTKTKATTKVGKEIVKESDNFAYLERVDFGGPDGHVPEEDDYTDIENLRVTRCSTSRSAITAYMCGAEVAKNQDAAHGLKGKMNNYGTKSFREYIACRHKQGKENGNHRRSVYRLGIGCKDNLAGYSHAFSIVAQPDGTFFWLQSFIGHYSLATWMKETDSTKLSGLKGHLTYNELMAKLDTVDRLMNINDWTDQANSDYNDLFWVDKNLERLGDNKVKKFNLDHRLEQFSWDEACEYPLPDGHDLEREMDSHALTSSDKDQCAGLLVDISLHSLLEMIGETINLDALAQVDDRD